MKMKDKSGLSGLKIKINGVIRAAEKVWEKSNFRTSERPSLGIGKSI